MLAPGNPAVDRCTANSKIVGVLAKKLTADPLRPSCVSGLVTHHKILRTGSHAATPNDADGFNGTKEEGGTRMCERRVYTAGGAERRGRRGRPERLH